MSLVLHYRGDFVLGSVDSPAVRATLIDSTVLATMPELYGRLACCSPRREGGDGQWSPPKHQVNHNEASPSSWSSHLWVLSSIRVCRVVLRSWFINRFLITLAASHSDNEGVNSPSVFYHLVARLIHALVFTRLHQPRLLNLPELCLDLA